MVNITSEDMDSSNSVQEGKSKLEDKQPGSRLEKLPHELCLEIVSRLSFVSLIRFMCTSRFCNQLSQEPKVCNRFENDDPLLILTVDSILLGDLYFVELTNERSAVVRKMGTPFGQAHLAASCNGMLCLCDEGTVYIYNPFTKKCKELRKSSRAHNDQDKILGFGFHPLAKEYKILKMLYQRGTGIFISVHTIGVHERVSVVKAPPFFEPESSEALVNGRLHWSSSFFISSTGANYTKKIISFDLLDEQFIDIPLPGDDIEKMFSLDVVVLGGFLSGVFRSKTGFAGFGSFEIWVMREYEVVDSWTHILHVDVGYLFVEKQLYPSLELKKVVCLLKNGKVLVLYGGGILISHDLNGGHNTELVVDGKPDSMQALAHEGSFSWIDTPIRS